jgi:hypothetical protein
MVYEVTKVGDLKQAGPNWLKKKLTMRGPDGEKNVSVWCKSADAAGQFVVGSKWEGEIKYKEPKDPSFSGEYFFSGKLIEDAQPAKAESPHATPQVFDDREIRIARQNAINAAGAFYGGTKVDPEEYWALARQNFIYTTTGKIARMSTKEQHEAILAMFNKDGKPDIDSARGAVYDFAGVPSLRALTYEEAADFLEAMTQN